MKRTKQGTTAQGKLIAPQTAEEYFALTVEQQDTWNRITHAVSKMRNNDVSLRQAEQEFALPSGTVQRLAGSALRKEANGQYVAQATDRLLRVLVFPTSAGTREIAVRDSNEASQVAKFWTAAQRYLETGDASELSKFEGMHVTDASGTQVSFLTDLDELDRLGSAGVLSFESLYARSA